MALDATQGRILVVDDDIGARRTCQDLLDEAGHASVGAAGATEARRVSEEWEPALTILDIVLPDGDGLELLHDLRVAWPSMPALVMTDRGDTRSVVDAMRAGAFDYLIKPVQAEGLLSACRTALARRGARLPEDPTHASGKASPGGAWLASCGHLRPLREIEDAYIDHVLALTAGNRTRAARILGVARETLRTRMLTRRAAS